MSGGHESVTSAVASAPEGLLTLPSSAKAGSQATWRWATAESTTIWRILVRISPLKRALRCALTALLSTRCFADRHASPRRRAFATQGDRVYAKTLGAFVRATGQNDSVRLRLGLGKTGDTLYPTEVEAERAARLAAEQEVVRLKALLAAAKKQR
jgi:hypothetical protein